MHSSSSIAHPTLLEAKEGDQAYLPLIFGTELIIDTTYRQVIIDGEPVALTCKEFELPRPVFRRAGEPGLLDAIPAAGPEGISGGPVALH